MISIILPVRKNSSHLVDCLQTIREKTVNYDDTEVLVGIDKDDEGAENLIKKYHPLIKAIPLDQSLRKLGLHEYTNILVRQSRGGLVWWLADDVRIMTYGYDQVLNHLALLYANQIYKFSPMPDFGGGEAFGILTRKWLETLGHWSLHPSIDSWVNAVGEYLPDNRRMPIYGLYIETLTVMGKAQPVKDPAPTIPIPLYKWGSEAVLADIKTDADKLLEEIKNG